MENGLAFDTTFLIDLQRELRAGNSGPASAYLERAAEKRAFLSAIAFGEFAEGFSNPNHPMLREISHAFEILPIDVDTAGHYGRITRHLRENGSLIGANDLWIAASAVQHQLPLVTANKVHFQRIERLILVNYRL